MENDKINKIKSEIKEVLVSHSSVKDTKVIYNQNDNEFTVYLLSNREQVQSNFILGKILKENLPARVEKVVFRWIDNLEEFIHIKSENVDEEIRKTDGKLPKTETENDVLKIWKEVLNVENIGIDDVFFEIGGDSLKCSQVFYLLNEKYPNAITLVDLFKFNTIESVSSHIDMQTNKEHSKKEIEGIQF
ncbi:hypothetical protein FZC78_22530 [Rossellomorea vietnamensis]|uniref:Carrier domain-containing protein n=1 Tax=Rossellomorea vietnamensis TaxID=218284 RepID=A0A5D4NFH5_9BACI|nr:phosphopantetheine-binding protein [Rossellomorea vietnamensis]TYS13035.1 hypothetical protein FZC78_22530 [Rossellomorea vietnamensis]